MSHTYDLLQCTHRHIITTPHSYTLSHLHHREVPLLGCEVKAAGALVEKEEEVAAALLDEQLW
jgi:hypothetical protein